MIMVEFTCGQCGEEFSTNCDISDIECPECGSRRCEHCAKWSST